eukprot:TRINITY_DN14978_c0_g1_i2.p1 TRINITY_DN14978_c0_g1~~TRINITY_DN14978_c0_g1_i2.p1  ORF type:complete len:349 (+),score=75.95 TRINITY_DN14978_c0_g1_i2:61-1107(+)
MSVTQVYASHTLVISFFFFLMIRRPPRSTLSSSSAASDVYKRQVSTQSTGDPNRSVQCLGVPCVNQSTMSILAQRLARWPTLLRLKRTVSSVGTNKTRSGIASSHGFRYALMPRGLCTSAKPSGLWHSAQFWGTAGALAGWGMTGAAVWDASQKGPEIISMNMTGVMLVYSSLFARWAFVVTPQNLLLCACHVSNLVAQANQMRRAINHKLEQGKAECVAEIGRNAAVTAAVGAGCVVAGPTVQSWLVAASLGPVSAIAAAEAGPFTVHFWAPMSKWLISGASFLDLERPTDKISLAQYTALTLTGAFFSRYAMLVSPINYTLCSVNIALFGSSAWHLGRKINADFLS